MASIEFIEKRMAGKEKEVDRLTKKLDRINKAKESGWKNNPYYYTDYDLRSTTKDLQVAQDMLEKYRSDLVVAKEKEGSRNVEVILEFLERWKRACLEYYKDQFDEYLEALEEYYKKDHEYTEWYNHGGYNDPNRRAIQEENRDLRRKFERKWSFITPYVERVGRDYQLDMNKIEYDLKQEADRKYDFIIERTNKIVGQITDASGLYIGDKGDLNGIIVGTKGKARVQTIGAGGYHIQIFHYRTLIHKVD